MESKNLDNLDSLSNSGSLVAPGDATNPASGHTPGWYSCAPPDRPTSMRIAAGVTIVTFTGAGFAFGSAICYDSTRTKEPQACAFAWFGQNPAHHQPHIEVTTSTSGANTVVPYVSAVLSSGPIGPIGPLTA